MVSWNMVALFVRKLWKHQIDVMDANMMMMTTATQTLDPGQFSQRVWALSNRNFYKPRKD